MLVHMVLVLYSHSDLSTVYVAGLSISHTLSSLPLSSASLSLSLSLSPPSLPPLLSLTNTEPTEKCIMEES